MTHVRKQSRTKPASAREPSPTTLPQLSAFLSGYLHQDFQLDHGSPAAALQAFLAEADPGERAALRNDWRRFLAATEGRTWAEIKRAFLALGGAWSPPSRTSLVALFSEID